MDNKEAMEFLETKINKKDSAWEVRVYGELLELLQQQDKQIVDLENEVETLHGELREVYAEKKELEKFKNMWGELERCTTSNDLLHMNGEDFRNTKEIIKDKYFPKEGEINGTASRN